MMYRRSFMQLTASSAVLAVAGWPTSTFARSVNFSKPLAIPPLLKGEIKEGRRVYDLVVQKGTSNFLPGVATPTIGVNGAYLGPTIQCRVGDKVTLNVHNSIGEPTTVHWHGLHLPARFDGGPHQVVAAGKTWESKFEIKQQPSMCWYHSHLIGRTGEQVLRGLAGLFLIEANDPAKGGLPHEYGIDDIPLVIQDRRFNTDGTFDYGRSMHDTMMGYRGNVMLVNGTVGGFFDVKRARTRLRILNGSNARIYNVGLDNGRELIVIGSDGSLLERPSRQRTVRLAPGERVEVLVDMKPDESVRLASFADGTQALEASQSFPLVEFRAKKLDGTNPDLLEMMVDVPSWRLETAHRSRVFELQMGMMGMMGGGRGGGMMGRGMMGGGMLGGGGGMTINGHAMDPKRINEHVKLGAIEIWEIRNSTPLAHPFHIHNIQFRVLDRNGRPPLPQELGLKDTVLVDPNSRVRVITEFTDYADPDTPYMYHCHILEHEDAGMMGQFVVT